MNVLHNFGVDTSRNFLYMLGLGGEGRGVPFPSHPLGESVSKRNLEAHCSVTFQGPPFWRPWWKEAPATRHQTPATSNQKLWGKAKLCCCRDCQLLRCGLKSGRLTANLQPGALFPNGGTQLCPPFLIRMWLPESLGPSWWYLSFSLRRRHALVLGIMTRIRNTAFHPEVALGWWVNHFIFLSFT